MIAFVRHGQTAINREGRFQGRTDPVLTDVGRGQADRAAELFATSTITRLVSSPLTRAIETATPIARMHDLPIERDARLVELDYGEWDERGLRDVTPDEWARWRADPSFAPPGGESLAQVNARVAEFCTDYIDDELVVAVSHVSPIKAAVCWALGVDAATTWRLFLDLASVTRIGRRGDGPPYLASFNETAPDVSRP